MAQPGTVTGWKVRRDDRERLLRHFPPVYPDIIADHVTLWSRGGADTPLPSEVGARIVGRADDGNGLECLVVMIDGTTDRPDGSTYHITWSLSAGREARESNDILRGKGWSRLETPIGVGLDPARF
jgi:hypothetical protein